MSGQRPGLRKKPGILSGRTAQWKKYKRWAIVTKDKSQAGVPEPGSNNGRNMLMPQLWRFRCRL